VTLRIGLVGCGGISERHGAAAANTDDVSIVACCDVRAEAADPWRDRYGTVDRLHGLIEYENGVVGLVESSKRGDFDHELKVSGAGVPVVLTSAWRIDRPTTLTLSRSSGWGEFETVEAPVPAADAFRLQLERFGVAARSVAEPAPALAESVVGICTIDALLTSAEERVAIPVAIPEAVRAEHEASRAEQVAR
jgi:predicted dehydrogenase